MRSLLLLPLALLLGCPVVDDDDAPDDDDSAVGDDDDAVDDDDVADDDDTPRPAGPVDSAIEVGLCSQDLLRDGCCPKGCGAHQGLSLVPLLPLLLLRRRRL